VTVAYGISGGPIEHFREGWALPINFSRNAFPKPHYYKRRDLTHVYESLCGLVVDQSKYLPGAQVVFEPGVFMVERCKNCRRMHPMAR
jgi:hypothetical protein